MAVKFTGEQQKAIETLDKSVLVAAAAGSGKTAVLVQRIINIILDGKADVDEMLVVTFTKAAAAEMRIKLAKAIKDRMRTDPDTRDALRGQLNKLYKAYISTFDSFAVRVLREFFYEIDINPDFRACDEVQSTLLQRAAVDQLFEDAFEDDSLIEGGSFREFLRLYSSDRTEEHFKDDMLEAYAKLRTMPDYFDWAYARAEQLNINRKNMSDSEIGKMIAVDAAEVFGAALKGLAEIRELYVMNGIEDMFHKMLGKEADAIQTLYDKACSECIDDEFFAVLEGIEFVNLQKTSMFFEPKIDDEKKKIFRGFSTSITPIRSVYRDEINKGFKMRYFVPDIDTRIRETNETYAYTVYYINLLKKFEEYYAASKNDMGLLDFADMEHYAVKILDRGPAAEVLRKRFKYIFIDEYQDTNNIQEHLTRCIAREDNLFKVGDVKQSIYRFRQAEPSIFRDTYAEYSDESRTWATAIDLNNNFRSNDRTIKYINAVFEQIMDGYDDKARLYTGCPDKEGYTGKYDFIPEVHVLTAEWDEEAAAEPDYESEAAAEDAGSADDEIESIGKEEAEAAYIAKLASNIIGTEFCDTKTGKVRKAEARDIAILFRSVKMRGEVLARALRNVGVQSHIEEDDDFFDTVEIGIALSLFSCIDNMKRDVPLIATLHSEIFAWSPDELAEIRIASEDRRAPYWEALAAYAENGADEALREKANYAIRKIKEWRTLSRMMPIEDFVWKVLVESGYYLHVGAMYGGDRRQANLRALVDRARKYSEDSIASLSSFLDFLGVMKKKGVKNGQASMVSKDDNVVRITTIHKSKGLEYPFVIVGGLGCRFVKSSNAMKFSFDSKLGLAMPYVSPDRCYWRSSLMQRAINVKADIEEYEENLRVLYVAMTRARNKLHLVGTVRKEENLVSDSGRKSNYLQILSNVIDTPYNEYHIQPLEQRDPEKDRIRVSDILATRPKQMSPETLKIYEELDRRLSFVYEDEELLSVPAKYSVSAIRREQLRDESEYVRPENEIISLWQSAERQKKAGAADIGIAYHRIMEFLDFAKVYKEDGSVDVEYISDRAEYLAENSAIERDVYNSLDIDKIAAFFRTDIGKRAVAACKSGTLRKEKAFTLRTEWKEKEILVQGVIDCCWEENGKAILLDYKSSFINPKKPREEELERIRHEYQMQLDLYSEAIEKGLGIEVGEAYLYLFAISEALSL